MGRHPSKNAEVVGRNSKLRVFEWMTSSPPEAGLGLLRAWSVAKTAKWPSRGFEMCWWRSRWPWTHKRSTRRTRPRKVVPSFRLRIRGLMNHLIFGAPRSSTDGFAQRAVTSSRSKNIDCRHVVPAAPIWRTRNDCGQTRSYNRRRGHFGTHPSRTEPHTMLICHGKSIGFHRSATHEISL